MNATISIREVTRQDREAIHSLLKLVFAGPEEESVSRLAVELVDDESVPPTLSLVAETEGQLVGHVAFSPVTLVGEGAPQGYLLAPLGVKPDRQKGGIGTRLVETGVDTLRRRGVGFLLVYGDPAYYGRFGFNAEDAVRFVPPYELEHPFGWLAVSLSEKPLPERPARVSCVAPLCDPELW